MNLNKQTFRHMYYQDAIILTQTMKLFTATQIAEPFPLHKLCISVEQVYVLVVKVRKKHSRPLLNFEIQLNDKHWPVLTILLRYISCLSVEREHHVLLDTGSTNTDWNWRLVKFRVQFSVGIFNHGFLKRNAIKTKLTKNKVGRGFS